MSLLARRLNPKKPVEITDAKLNKLDSELRKLGLCLVKYSILPARRKCSRATAAKVFAYAIEWLK